ncbi:MAG: alanine racemase, partial [Treponema sp.]|nr:alanine racemase [Treponema sp.]
KCALEAGAEYFAVADVSEGGELRAGGIAVPILLFSQALPEELPEIVSLELTPLVSDADFIDTAAAAARKANKQLTVHLKVDTGMGRLGCRPEEAASLAARIVSHRRLNLGGVATHLSVADSSDEGNIAYTREQLRRFRETITSIKSSGVEPGIVHAANSGGLVFHEESHFDMIRPGLFLYGYTPETKLPEERPAIFPVMELRSAVVYIKKAKKGEAISYGRTWTAGEDTLIGVIPAGYADGFPRLLSNNHSVFIRGKPYPVVGTICMDQCMINLGKETEVQRWDEVVIFGPGYLTAADMARKCGTIPYEITCNINKRVPRDYTV